MLNSQNQLVRIFRSKNKSSENKYFIKSPLSLTYKSVPEVIIDNYILLEQIEDRILNGYSDSHSLSDDIELMTWGIDQLWENPHAMSIFTEEYFEILEFFDSRFQEMLSDLNLCSPLAA